MNKVLAALIGFVGMLVSASAATWSVTNSDDAGAGSLRQAIVDSNSSEGSDEIIFATATGAITLQSALPAVIGETTITGPGASALTVSGNRQSQLLIIGQGSQVSLTGITFAEGYAEAYLHGGAIANFGKLTITECTFTDNRTHGGFGGAIYNEGDLTISNSRLEDNRALGGASAGSGPGGSLGGGGGGFGGAIFSASGTLDIEQTFFLANSAIGGSGVVPFSTGGAPQQPGAGGGPSGGAGGAIPATGIGLPGAAGGFGSGGGAASNQTAGTPGGTPGAKGGDGGFGGGGGASGRGTTTLGGNTQGGSGGYGGGHAASTGEGGGGAGFGGAVFVQSGSASIKRSVIAQNSAAGGDSGDDVDYGCIGGAGGAGMGGAIFLSGGFLLIDETSLRDNSTRAGVSGKGHFNGGLGAEGGGGAVMNYGGELQLVRSTLSGNRVRGGNGGSAVRGSANGGDGFGGGLACAGGHTLVIGSTISGNLAVAGNTYWSSSFRGGEPGTVGGAGIRQSGGDLLIRYSSIAQNVAQAATRFAETYLPPIISGPRYAGGIYATGPAPSLQNSIFSGNRIKVVYPADAETDSDGAGTFASLGHNVVQTSAGMTGLVASDITNLPAQIGPLQDNGGPTETHALALSSPAVDAAAVDDPMPTDQRGVPRPQGVAADIGAYEVSALAILLDGKPALPGPVVRNAPTLFQIQSIYPSGAIFYTLDGSTPTLNSTRYSQPVILSGSAVIRAVAFDPSFTKAESAGPVQLTIIPPRKLTLVPLGQGSISTAPQGSSYPHGTTVTLTATPAQGWRFQGWSGALSGSASPAMVVMDADKTVEATFVAIPTYSLTLSQSGLGNVVRNPAVGPYLENTSVTLTATSSTGWVFVSWSGAAGGNANPLQITMDANKSVRANFLRIVAFAATTKGGGSVQVNSSKSPPYLAGDVVNATAVPAPGWQFLRWLGGVQSTNPAIAVTLDRDTAIEAVFGTTLELNPVGNGTLSAKPAAPVYSYGSLIRLSAVASPGHYYSSWGDPIGGNVTPIDFTITQPELVVSAIFLPLGEGDVALNLESQGRGMISVNPPGAHFPRGTRVQLTALPDAGHAFLGWNGDASGSKQVLEIILNDSKSIGALFTTSVETAGVIEVLDPVPGGTGAESFASFGVPAVNDSGQFAFWTSIQTAEGITPAIYGRNQIVAQKGQSAPGTQGLVFHEFAEPVIDQNGDIAFISTVTAPDGRGALRGIWTDASDTVLKLVALEGTETTGIAGGHWADFRSVSLQGGQLLISASLKKRGGINALNDRAVWTWTAADGVKLQLREGVTQVATAAGLQTVKQVAIVPPVAGSLAQGRNHAGRASDENAALSARVTFADKTHAIVTDDRHGSFLLETSLVTGESLGEDTEPLPGAEWKTFGFPAWSMEGSRLGFLAGLASSSRAITKANDTGIFVSDSTGRLTLRLREGDQAVDSLGAFIDGVRFKAFKEPLIGGAAVEYSFIGRLVGDGVTAANDDGLWSGGADSLRLIAREGEQAVGGPSGARWKSFYSVALGAARGPVFVADLSGVPGASRRGLWSSDSAGTLNLFLRQGDRIAVGNNAKGVQSFTVLAPAKGAEGTARGVSPSGNFVVAHVVFTDRGHAIVRIAVP